MIIANTKTKAKEKKTTKLECTKLTINKQSYRDTEAAEGLTCKVQCRSIRLGSELFSCKFVADDRCFAEKQSVELYLPRDGGAATVTQQHITAVIWLAVITAVIWLAVITAVIWLAVITAVIWLAVITAVIWLAVITAVIWLAVITAVIWLAVITAVIWLAVITAVIWLAVTAACRHVHVRRQRRSSCGRCCRQALLMQWVIVERYCLVWITLCLLLLVVVSNLLAGNCGTRLLLLLLDSSQTL